MLNAHNVLQLGWQSAFGTANGTATRKLQNVSSFKLRPELETRALDQLRGTLAPTHQTVLDRYLSSATAETSDTDFEELNYWLEMLFGTVSPGITEPYLRTYSAPTTSAPAPRYATLQFGQTNEVWQMQDASVTSLTLSGAANSGVSVGASLIGGKVVEGALATLQDLTTGTRLSGCMASVKLADWSSSTFTALASSAFSWELSVNANRVYDNFLGECTPSKSYDGKWTGQLKLSVELNNTSDDLLVAMLTSSASKILEKRVQIIYTTGTGTSLRSMTIDFAGHSMQAPELFQDKNGLMTYDLVLDGVYNPTASNWLTIKTESALATV